MDRDDVIPGRGPLNAEIVVCGEAPGKWEMHYKLPFVGPSGKLQDEWITEAGLHPHALRYENVYPTMPPGGHIEAIPWEELQRWQEDLRARLDDLPSIRVVVPTGNVALSALIACAVPSMAKITQRRGSIYLWEQASGRKVKVIPVIHPAHVLREEGERSQEEGQKTKKNYEFRCRADWRKIAREVGTGIADTPPHRDLWLQPAPDSAICSDLLHLAHDPRKRISFDIETNPEADKILCISFAPESRCAVSVPWSARWKDWIGAMLASPCAKIAQNGHYDCYWLAWEGFTVTNWQHDTMAKSCLLWPGEPHSLAYLASILTREPWYKGGDEDTGEQAWRSQNWEALLAYNARDAAVTWEVDDEEDRHLAALDWEQVYQDQYQALFQPMLAVMLHGIGANRDELHTAYHLALTAAQQEMEQAGHYAQTSLFRFDTQVQEACYRVAVGEWDRNDPAVAKKLKRAKGDESQYVSQVEAKGISTQILARVLYTTLGLPTQRNRRTHSITTDEGALLKLRARYKDTAKYAAGISLIEHVLTYREQKKQSEFLNPRRLDSDGRFRASYSFRPTTGRLSSASNPRATGGNAQNIDRQLRGPFKPDAGCLLLEVDLSQAEARVLYCLIANNPHLVELAHTRPSQFDVHTFMASEVLGLGPWDATETGEKQKKADRYLAKRVVHATHYDMHENKGSEICLKDNHDISPRRFKSLQERYKAFAYGLDAWQTRTRMEGLSTRTLTNSWGRTIHFPYDRPGDDWYRRLYAWRPQSDIARHLNYAWVRLHHFLQEGGYASKVNLQLHDALVLSVVPEESWNVMHALVSFCEERHSYYGEELQIPTEIKLGLAWGQGIEFKERPTREEWEYAIRTAIECMGRQRCCPV